ncbi:domain of unknown function DUF1731 [Chloroherpeton thalassium ATCC 35110]|uniref:NAD-dependent epimerase/dehydratase n=1 Tax=Chloroherpeton thalassium (strain ATCC 35110 / GB-78) TaxID=517418 RepID=B3QW85_CHLT3|nr:TIGR01777 family oxidoreductase [Chloroherpeton thalassium]ACF13198.1 domain of unknown function DUF1731 [Chloroherpeton thalassium ATCC 35110]
MSKKIVITGATGLLGPAIFEQLKKEGHELVLFSRNPKSAQSKLLGAKQYVAWDAASRNGEWKNALEGTDVVIHLAGVPVAERWSEEYKKAIYDSRVEGTRNLVAAMAELKKKPEVLISSSAIGYYGTQPQSMDVPALTESSPAGSDFLAKVCVDWEAEALKAESFGVRTALIRTGIVLSTKGGALGKMLMPFRFFVGGPLGTGKQWVSWIHIDDETEVFLYPMKNPRIRGAMNAVAPTPITMQAFAEAVGHALSRPSLFPVPKFVLQAMLGEAADAVGEGQKVIPQALLENGFSFRFPEIEAAVRDLLSYDK